jgi:superfamily II DNA or RNA helicase
MPRVLLQEMLEYVRLENLPAYWCAFDLEKFARDKTLWDYQQNAVANAVKVLWRYYEDGGDYQPHEKPEINGQRKQKLHDWYRTNGLTDDLDIELSDRLAALLGDYYPVGADGKLAFQHYLNRACFWMATGSGKTLVIVKLIEVLRELIRRGEIPANDILVLTHRDDLIEQLRKHVDEFNAAHSELRIHLRELREYAAVKRENPWLFRERELTVFYYRSDNLSDEQKEKIVDFRNYDDDGKWYVLLDEAHKGDKEDSKRQHIYAVLSRNGFLFNFSATFTDARDLATTAYNFNLSEFIKAGYGKHLAILEQELRAFRDEEDYTGEEKQKIVLKSLILLAYARKFADQVQGIDGQAYHRPLLLTLVNSVNTEDADLKMFFRELERIGKGRLGERVWKQAKDDLWEELKENPAFVFEENARVAVAEDVFKALSLNDVLRRVFNASRPGDIEILVRPSNRQELAFKLKTSDRPFALIKIGDISGWLKEELAGYEVNERFEDDTYFEGLNTDDSEINILMGSRSFYEGWDSNRPNVINFINIGTGTDAKKFILQSVGRGVRIQPVKGKRKRLLALHNAVPREVDDALFEQIKDKVQPLETLFIFGTNRKALKTVIEHLDREGGKGKEHQLSLFVNEEAKKHPLLIPVYRYAEQPLAASRDMAKFSIEIQDLALLQKYAEYVNDDRVMLALHETQPDRVAVLRQSAATPDAYYTTDGKRLGNAPLLVDRILDYFDQVPQEFDKLKVVENEIRHFEHVRVALEDITELQTKVNLVREYTDPTATETALDDKFARGEISKTEYKAGIKKLATMVREQPFQYGGKRLTIRNVANHYYIPLMLTGEEERLDYIKHIVQELSEVEFLNKLEEYLGKPGNQFTTFDWWMFSKLDESLDDVYIPYYEPTSNRAAARFKPDFIFWLQKDSDYHIVFFDPKGTEHTAGLRKLDGYRRIFETHGTVRMISHAKTNVRVHAFLHTSRLAQVPADYRRHWFDSLEGVFTEIINQ